MALRSANAEWNGSLKEGTGRMKMASGSYDGAYSFSSRFEEGEGTNPEELIAAAHAGCFSMAFSGELGKAGYEPKRVATKASVHLTKGDAGFSLSRIDLETEAEIPGIEDDEFQRLAEAAKKGCPVSRALGGVPDIRVSARLV